MNFLKGFRAAEEERSASSLVSQTIPRPTENGTEITTGNTNGTAGGTANGTGPIYTNGQFWDGLPQKPGGQNTDDPVTMHLLMETALGESKNYDILSPDELDVTKKDLATITGRIEAATRKLAMESKVRNAAHSLSKLSRSNSRDLTNGPRGEEEGGSAKEDAIQSARKCEEIAQDLLKLQRQEQQLQTKLLEHTSGVLQMTHKGYLKKDSSEDDVKERKPQLNGFGDPSHYQPFQSLFTEVKLDEGPSSAVFAEQNRMILDVEQRVEDLNARLRDMILELKPDKRELPHPPLELRDNPDNPQEVLFGQVNFMEQCLEAMHELQKARGVSVDNFHATQVAELETQKHLVLDVEQRVESLNARLRGTILALKPSKEDLPHPARELRDNPENPGEILEGQVVFLDQCLVALQKLQDRDAEQREQEREAMRRLQERQMEAPRGGAGIAAGPESEATEEKLEILNTQLYQIMVEYNPEKAYKYTPPPEATGETLPDQFDYLQGGLGAVGRRLQQLVDISDTSSTKLAQYQDRAEQYVNVVGGLWDIITAPDASGEISPSLQENFSLTMFSTKVQELHGKYASLQEQKIVLTRQIQQQRELNSTADAEKDSKMTKMMADLDQARADLEAAKKSGGSADAQKILEEQLQRANKQLEEQSANSALLEVNARALKADIEAQTAAATKAESALKELEGEVVRLQTELTITRAELDSAHGTRAERAAEVAAAGAGEAAALQTRIATLQKELSDTIGDYEAMTRASIEYEKERESLEAAADKLRERVGELESQLADEKIQNLNGRSPAMSERGGLGVGGTSTSVLKTEFKRMMRETRMEHNKVLRAEQEERRRLEALVRTLKKDAMSSRVAAR